MYGYEQQRQAASSAAVPKNMGYGYSTSTTPGQASALMTYNNFIQSLGQNSSATSYPMDSYGSSAAVAAGYGQAMDSYSTGGYNRTYSGQSANNIPLGGGNGYSGYSTQASRTARTTSAFGVMAAPTANKRVVGRAAWPKKQKIPKPPVDPSQYFCDTCNVSCGGPQAYNDHLAGKSHKRKEEAAKKGTAGLPAGKKSYKCEVCSVTCTSKEAFDTHLIGAKHNKAVNILKKLGKPIPESVTNVIMPHGDSSQHLPVNKKVVGVTSTPFVGGNNLSTTKNEEEDDVGDDNDEVEVPPVGEEFLDEVKGGKVISYFCKLCECTCGDPSARNLHVKGRRHRLQYKLKVDSSIQVDLKPHSKIRGVKNAHLAVRKAELPKLSTCSLYGSQTPSVLPDTAMYDAYDEQHVHARLEQIKPELEQIKDCERLVGVVEKALKKISDKLTEENGENDGERTLRGVIRVGPLGEHLLLKTDKQINTVLLCREIPTISLLQKLVQLFPQNVEDETERSKVSVESCATESGFIVRLSDVDLKCVVTLSCVGLRQVVPSDAKKDGQAVEEKAVVMPPDPLPKENCLKALADLRHTKFFQSKCMEVPSLVEVVLLLRDVGARIDTWSVFSLYVLELLVYKTILSHPMPMRVSDAFRRFFEVMSTGQYLSIRSTLEDPCEKDGVNPLADLTKQQRENIICSAQHGLRLIAYDQIHTILGMERVESQSRKRTSGGDDSGVESKKEKLEESEQIPAEESPSS
ncbi:unnamed protein product [Bursaphelenchus xylophilus]|uniref:(pine wood nematode) hypothetical protein n=1 Tax=Bursaphelenchus xylophilus TaxID=6326 RepID=A0A1I7S8Z1_BURXY|nr:unnamed protein product [Bursaphelenchus xylophilus]CAG9086039.1 unnamed protein product [Bursaphelenchus xylophilus]